jgi:uncharacterized protein (UPF0548 family)
MVDTMRERIARAMMDNQLGQGAYDEATFLGARAECAMWCSHADAALAAMREPTKAMVRAMAKWRGTELMDNAAEDEVRHELTAYWRVATDAARNEQPDEEASNG